MAAPRAYFWAVIEPSPQHSVAYLESQFATTAAASMKCGEYLALVTVQEGGEFNPNAGYAVAHIVQSACDSLPESYLPIAPCRAGSREPLMPGFEWPFGECVVNTSRTFLFDPCSLDSDIARPLECEAAATFSSVFWSDFNEQSERDDQRRRASELIERGVDTLSSNFARWTSFSRKSTVAQVVPGQFFPPSNISADVRHDIESLHRVLPASQCFEDEREIKRLRARFSLPETERTIRWTLDQASWSELYAPHEVTTESWSRRDVLEPLIDFERPPSPDRIEEDQDNFFVWGEDQGEDDLPWGDSYLPGIRQVFAPPPPLFKPRSLAIMYFDLYGTLIDNESGIFHALQPLLARCSSTLARSEALSFYFESEAHVKEQTPTAPYQDILAEAHSDMSRRLGLCPLDEQSSNFASSVAHWPLVKGAVECLHNLRPHIPALVALVDADYATLLRTTAFSLLAPYFTEVFTWDASHTYRPDLAAFDPPFLYHDVMGVFREHRCLVSNAVFRDLEPASEFELPVVWMRYPASLAANLPSDEASYAWNVYDQLSDLVFAILREKGVVPLGEKIKMLSLHSARE